MLARIEGRIIGFLYPRNAVHLFHSPHGLSHTSAVGTTYLVSHFSTIRDPYDVFSRSLLRPCLLSARYNKLYFLLYTLRLNFRFAIPCYSSFQHCLFLAEASSILHLQSHLFEQTIPSLTRYQLSYFSWNSLYSQMLLFLPLMCILPQISALL